MKRTRLIHLFALYSFSIACCAGNSTSTNKTVIQNDSTPSTLAATKSDKSFSASASLDSNALKIAAGDTSLALRVNGCSDFIDDMSLCNKGSELTIVNSTKKINQTIKLPSLFISSKYTLYRGTLSDKRAHDTYSFFLSDVNGDGNDDLIIWTGRDGGYGGPSFDVYLYNPAEHKFIFNQPYSDLTIGSSDLFTIKNGEIENVSKDGCCTHIFETYKAEPDKPILIKRVKKSKSGN